MSKRPYKRQQTAQQARQSANYAQAAIAGPDTTDAPGKAAKAPIEVSAKVMRIIDAVREPFASFVDGFAAITADRATLAPKFMKAFGAWQAETAGTFIAFVRVFDATVPAERAAYRDNPVYQAADYLRRLSANAARPAAEANAVKPASPFEAVARLVATLAPLVEDMDLVWQAFLLELHWTDRQIARVQKLVGQAGPLLAKKAPQARKFGAIASISRSGTHG